MEIGLDDYTITTQSRQSHTYLGIYCCVMNVPIVNRLKRNDIFLLALIRRSSMAKANASINDVLRPILEELKMLEDEKSCIVKSVKFVGSNQFEPLRIRAKLASLCGDNVGQYEILGLRKAFYQSNFAVVVDFLN